MTRAAAYLRLSRQDQEKEGDKDSESIENQRCMIREYAKAHGYEIVKEYADEDYSGLTDQRPAFQQMLRAARKGMFEVILAKSQSRFSRNMRDIERYLHRELPLLGVRFLGILDGTDTGNHANKKARQIYALINEWYCEDLSEKDREFLQTFAFICELSFDVYIKKTLIEKMIDSLPQEDKKESKKDAKKEAKKTKK